MATSAWAEVPQVKQVPEKPVIEFKDGTKAKALFLKTIKTRFENQKMGEMHKGWLCSKSSDMVWNKKVYSIFSGKLAKAFRDELESAHFPTPVKSEAIFESSAEDDQPSEDLQVGIFIKEVNANFCVKSAETEGGVYLKIFWQVFSPQAQKVVYQATTEGTYQPGELVKTLPDDFFVNAFKAATRNLLAQQGLYDTITSTEVLKPKVADPKIVKLERIKPLDEPLAKNITSLRAAVVTVTGETGSGSGFFISKEGHLLTNYHVVGSQKFLKLKLSTGRELVGEVLRSDKTLDVALLKAEQTEVTPLAVRSTESNIGEDVFVLGSPLGEKFNTTLTKGILSGYRSFKDHRYLQSDVSILPGNSGGPLLDPRGSVLGITVAGLGAKGLAGMNFFIPIQDALEKLGIELQGDKKP
ncbi:hypothetical protein GMST_07510 [Geomonas silvestris]|uniref:Serine protease n=1 Tax=Geomonas silvestris TaxID=2740184 RepID=A0A6V8MEJ8_9BACT|nr:hypothetical protein GMST_07510 [Geomonas silvestris]